MLCDGFRGYLNDYTVERPSSFFTGMVSSVTPGDRNGCRLVQTGAEDTTDGDLLTVLELTRKDREKDSRSLFKHFDRGEWRDGGTDRDAGASVDRLRPGGRMCVISYHSLEDRLVKHFFRSGNFEGKQMKDFYGNVVTPFRLVNRKVIVPTEEEQRLNPRARSAKLRVAEKI